MESDTLAGPNDSDSSAQFSFVHDADRLHQPVAQHVGGFVFGEYEELFQRDVQVLGDQFQRIKAWVMDATLKAGQVVRVNCHETGKPFLRQASFLAKFLDPPPDLYLRIRHSPSPSCIWVISHRDRGRDSVQGIPKFKLSRCQTFTCGVLPDTIDTLRQIYAQK